MKKVTLLIIVFLLVGCSRTDSNNLDNYKLEENVQIDEVVMTIGDTLFYIHKIKDKDYTTTYGDGQNIKIYYTAAEKLGQIGKPAIPFLIENLNTNNVYERTLTIYALLLSSQHQNVKEFTYGDYINVNLDFNPENHEEYIKIIESWWEKYKHNWK